MTELVKGQNLVWPAPTLTIEVHGLTCDVSALLVGDDLRVSGAERFVFYNHPAAPGARWSAGPPQHLVLELAALPTSRVLAVVSVDPGAPPLGMGPAPQVRLLGPDGSAVTFRPSGLTSERALICVEAYRRAGQWKVRAVGQGYSGGLAAAITAHGVEVEDPATSPGAWSPPAEQPGAAPVAASHQAGDWTGADRTGADRTGSGWTGASSAPGGGWAGTAGQGPAGTAPGPVTSGPSQLERLLHQLGCIFDDASRSAAGLESTLEHARNRLVRIQEESVSDPRLRSGPAADETRVRAQADHDALTGAAFDRHHQDVAQLTAELGQWETLVPAALADWSAAGWRTPRPPGQVPAVRLGVSHTEHAPGLLVPFLASLPLTRPIWFVTGPGGEPQALRVVRALLLRMLAAFGPGGLRLVVADLAQLDPFPFAPLGGPGCRVQDQPGAGSLAELSSLLGGLVHRADLAKMAYEAGMDSVLDDQPATLLVITGFPTGFDEPTLATLENVLEIGPFAGIQVVLTGPEQEDPPPAVARVLDLCRHFVSGAGGGFIDPQTRVAWAFLPDTGPQSPALTHAELSRASRGE